MSETTPENVPDADAAPAATSLQAAPRGYSDLPPYSRSLLKIELPVRVVLVSCKESLKEVVELTPGGILKFDKSCEELLHLYVGDQRVAEGEAVKVGDRFGLRVLSMLMPEEHFLKAQVNKAS